MTLSTTTARPYGEIVARQISDTESLAFYAWQSADAAEESGDAAQAAAWTAEADRLFAEVDALKASL